MKSTIKNLKRLIEESDAIIVGIGSGMSASGGLDYTDTNVFKKLYSEYYELGFKNIFEAISKYWVTSITEDNAFDYWKFWRRHIYNVRYNIGVTKPYEYLYEILKNKNYYVITTNCDGQSQKVFKDVYAPQGDYSLLQCINNCNDKIYCNKDVIYKKDFDITYIPRCEYCGNFLIPNLRCDDYFCETKASEFFEDYKKFFVVNKNKKLLLLEIGVGFNTPGIIRYPFDQISQLENVTLVRINKKDFDVLDNQIGIGEDILKVLESLL